ncbi:DUF1624 domain-containing protein [Candidatus Woesearchaeota archaeon]|nr:DUF1624 domain-containing protein [Candidatus Woesearchaeota archaeon]
MAHVQYQPKQRTAQPVDRLWEVDLARGIAILLVIVFHIFFDLDFLGIVPNEMFHGGWLVLQRIAALSFLGLAGVSVALAAAKHQDDIWKRCFRHGRTVFFWGIVVTAVTYLYLSDSFVVFGVLHLLGLSILLAPLFLRLPFFANALIAAAFYGVGKIVQDIAAATPAWLWLGIAPSSFSSVDYFPVFPWMGMVVLGVGLGTLLFPDGKRKINLIALPATAPRGLDWLRWLGTKTLWVYLIHQPVLIAVLTAWKSI